MVIFYNENGERIGKDYEVGWNFNQKRNKEGTGKIELIHYPKDAKYATLYKGTEEIKTVVLNENSSNEKRVSTSVKTLESLFKNYRLPENWRGWNKQPLSFVLADAIYGFDYIRKSTLADFTDYIEKVNVSLNKIKDGDIHLDYHEVEDGIRYYEQGQITFAFDCGEAISQRYIRWVETTGEKVYTGIQSVSSNIPITDISQVDFSNVPILTINRGVENDSSFSGLPIASDKRYVAVRIILKYVNPDWTNDFATHKVYNENNILVDRTVRGFTPVIRAFEIITRKKTEFNVISSPADMGELIEGIELSNITIWEAIQKIREKYPFDTVCYFKDGKVYFKFSKSLIKDKKKKAGYMLRAGDKITRHLNNTNIKELKTNIQKVNVLHCYGEGEKQQRLYVRIPETGTYDNMATVEDVFTDTKIKTKKELKKRGLEVLKEKRKDDKPVFEVETVLPIRLFDEVSLIHPETNTIYDVVVEEENISYKENNLTQKFGIGGFLFNPIEALIKKEKYPDMRDYAMQPFGLTAYGKHRSIVLVWQGVEENYIVKWKEKGSSEYNYRNVKGLKTEIEGLKERGLYLFSIASTVNNMVSDYTCEIEAGTIHIYSKEGCIFLSSLDIKGDYKNQTGTYQGLLYKWNGTEWELLNAVMPINPVCYYDFEDLPEFPDNLNDTYNKHFCNWKQKGKKISTPENMDWVCLDPNNYTRKVEQLNNGAFTVEVLDGYTGGYISPWGDVNRIKNKIVYMKFKVLKGKFRIGAESDCEDFTPNDGTQTISRFMYKDGEAFIYYASAGSKIFIEEIILIDDVFSDNYYPFGNEFNGDENRRRITVNEKGNFTVEIKKNKTVSGFYFVKDKKYADKIITLKFKVLKGDWYIGTEYWNFESDYEGYKGYWYKQGEEKTICIVNDFEKNLIVLSSGQGNKIEFSNIYIGDGSYKNNIVIDNSGNGNHGQLVGGLIKLRDEKVGTCLLFNKGGIRYKDLPLGGGKRWCHSCWIKMEEDSVLSFLHCYGYFDYFRLSYYKVITRTEKASCGIPFSADSFRNKGFVHLVFQTDLQPDYCEKEIYVNGVFFDKERTEGDFSKVLQDENSDLYCVAPNCKNIYFANRLFFDRLLTQQEILWLYHNPQYPVKNYTSADWAVCPQNPDNVLANATPKYLGVVESVPVNSVVTITKGEITGGRIANPGDWVLSGKTVDDWKVGICYKWNGITWTALEPAQNYVEEYQSCLLHMFEIEELKQKTGHYGALFAKVLVAQKALIDELIVKQLRIDSNKNSNNDFEAWFDEVNGLKINNEGRRVFEITPNGDITASAFKVRFGSTKAKEAKFIPNYNISQQDISSSQKIFYDSLEVEKITVNKNFIKKGGGKVTCWYNATSRGSQTFYSYADYYIDKEEIIYTIYFKNKTKRVDTKTTLKLDKYSEHDKKEGIITGGTNNIPYPEVDNYPVQESGGCAPGYAILKDDLIETKDLFILNNIPSSDNIENFPKGTLYRHGHQVCII